MTTDADFIYWPYAQEPGEMLDELRAENERLRDLIKDMSRAIDCLSTETPIRDLDEILLRVWRVLREGE